MWDITTLKEYVDAMLMQIDLRYQQRYDAQQKALDAALLAADRAVQAALQAAKEAVLKAELAADKRFELLNELRVGVATSDQLEGVEKSLSALSKRVDTAEGRTSGFNSSWGIFVAVAGIIFGIAAVWISRS